MFAGKKSAQIREILISESAWEEMTCLFAPSLGLWAGGRFPAKEVMGYIVAQVVGGIIAAGVLYVIASGKAGFDAAASGFASNGFGEHSPGGYSMLSAIVIEIVLTAGFLLVIHGATDKHAPAGFAPIAIGLALTLIHLISIPVTQHLR